MSGSVRLVKRLVVGGALLAGSAIFASGAQAETFNLSVVGTDGGAFNGFRYLVQEDCMYRVLGDPNAADRTPDGEQAFNFHKSHCHAIKKGRVGNGSASLIDVGELTGTGINDCFVSVIPNDPLPGVQPGGVKVPGCNADTTVVVPNGPAFQTSQISVKVFYDGYGGPLNNSPDAGEPGLAGFSVLVEDAAGQVQQDAFGNPLATTYQQNPDGSFVLDGDGMPMVQSLGTGEIVTTCSTADCSAPGDGELVIKFLAPGKYAIITVPPTANLNDPLCDPDSNTIEEIASNPQCSPGWWQNTTIEGTKVVDAWVAPGNGERLVEFGPTFPHIFHGWTPNDHDRRVELDVDGPYSISGVINKSHLSPPPSVEGNDGPLFTGVGQNGFCQVAANTIGGVTNEGAVVAECDAEGNFSINGLADGLYQLVVWDRFLHIIIGFQTVQIAGENVVFDGLANPEVQAKMWFNETTQNVFFDNNQDGEWQPDATPPELPLLEQATLLRFRDGTEYQAFPTDGAGAAPYETVFPWFHWLVAEVDFARFKATGATTFNDLGGLVIEGADGEGVRNPEVETKLSTDGPVLTQALQGFAGQNLRIDWGKALWPVGENGGLSGIVHYATTRAEDNPEQYAPEPWEPGIPHVQVALFVGRITNPGTPTENERPQTINGIAGIQQPDQDNWPLGFSETGIAGPEDINRTDATDPGLGYTNGFDYGDAVDIAWTDSWDDNLPEGCPHTLDPALDPGNEDGLAGGIKCMDGLANWNQIRDGVFDGGYAFGAGGYENPTGHWPSDQVENANTNFNNFIRNNFTEAAPGHLPGGEAGYVVQVYPPRALTGQAIYKISKSQDKNVDFGPNWTPSTAAIPEGVGRCTGSDYVVPAELSLFPGVDAPLAGQTLRNCNQRFQFLADAGEAGFAQNSAVSFYLHTDVPLAAKAIGQITDDLAGELAQGKPTSTEKFAPGFMSMAFFDYTGREVHRGYSSEFSKYNFLLPSTVSQNLPIPSGISPMMTRFCLNHPGPVSDGAGGFVTDPNFDARYSTTCYTFNFEPGKATYLDTPVIRLAAFVGPLQTNTDCEQPNGTPGIRQVITSDYNAPALSGVVDGKSITITALGDTEVPDPTPGNEDNTLTRDFGFGTTVGSVSIVYEGGQYTFPQNLLNWSNGSITANVPASAPAALQTGQLVVTRGDNGRSTTTGVTLHVGVDAANVTVVNDPTAFKPIQAAVDAASDGDLILVEAGTYDDNVIVYKEVKIQGAGAPSTQIFAAPFNLGAGTPQLPGENDKLIGWKDDLAALGPDGADVLGFLPGQIPSLPAQDAPGFLVIPQDGVFTSGDAFTARIDGFNVQGANLGGGIFVNAYADGLTVSNNRTISNLGQFGGGIRVGNPLVADLFARGAGGPQVLNPDDLEGVNPDVTLAYNEVIQNHSYDQGAGIMLYTGADNYQVTNNLMCGNLSRQGGGGLAQVGRVGGLGAGAPGNGSNEDGVIRDNVFIFNEVFQGNETGGGGGGIELTGEDPASLGTLLTEGTGSITIDRNLFHGNLAGSAPGGAIWLKGVNGVDVTGANGNGQGNANRWHRILVLNNLIENNVSGQWGAGINLSDTVRAEVIHNTLARNDNASVAANVRDPSGNLSDPFPSGLTAVVHSPDLAAVMVTQNAIGNNNDRRIYSHPAVLKNNIFNRNRSFWLDKNDPDIIRPLNQHPVLGGIGNSQWDLGVVGVPDACLVPRFSLVARTGGETPDGCNYDGANFNNDIQLGAGFVNAVTNALQATTAADEGGNDTQLLFTPLTLVEDEVTPVLYDYHIGSGSNAVGVGQDLTARYANLGTPLTLDVDAETRPSGLGAQDAGADQVSGSTGPLNNPPVAVNDDGAAVGARTGEGVPTVITVLTNDSDPDAGDVISVSQITTAPGNGTAEINGDGTVTYRPYGGFTGAGANRDPFFYEIEDSGALTDTARVRVRVDSTAALPETISVTLALYKQDAGVWKIEGQTNLQPEGATMEIRLHRNGALIATGVTVNMEDGFFYTGEVAPVDPAAVPVVGDHIIIRSVPNNRTGDGVVQLDD